MRTPVGTVALWMASSFVAACGFDHGVLPTDAPPIDVPPDVPLGMQPSCKALLAVNPGAQSGAYTIDPDGAAGEPPITVTCDMTTAGGGWTITYFAPSANMTSSPIPYTTATTRLLADAQSALIAYRNAAQQVLGSAYASFELPAEWKLDTPFNYPSTDIMVNVSVSGAAANPALLRYGYHNFASRCSDPWNPSSTLGRICIVGTNAPYHNAFLDELPDNCSSSVSNWDAAGCTTDLRFSIAVR